VTNGPGPRNSRRTQGTAGGRGRVRTVVDVNGVKMVRVEIEPRCIGYVDFGGACVCVYVHACA